MDSVGSGLSRPRTKRMAGQQKRKGGWCGRTFYRGGVCKYQYVCSMYIYYKHLILWSFSPKPEEKGHHPGKISLGKRRWKKGFSFFPLPPRMGL